MRVRKFLCCSLLTSKSWLTTGKFTPILGSVAKLKKFVIIWAYHFSEAHIMINFTGRHFPKDIILQTVRWYVAYSLSYRDVEELMQERGISVDHSTLNRWVIHYSALLENEFRHHHKKNSGCELANG